MLLSFMWMIWPKSFQLVSLLKLPQFLLDEVEEVSALKATAAAVQTHDYGVEGADQHRCPVHLKLLRHHLTTGGAVPNRVHQTRQNLPCWRTSDQTKASEQGQIHYSKTKLLFCFYMIYNKATGWMLMKYLGHISQMMYQKIINILHCDLTLFLTIRHIYKTKWCKKSCWPDIVRQNLLKNKK